MQFGIVFPQAEVPADIGFMRDYVRHAARMGYQHLLAYDHVVGADPAGHPGFDGPYDVDTPFQEPFTFYAWLAGIEPRLELVTGVIILPQRQTVLVAKQAAQVDILKRGRFRLGVGIGWNPVEYEALGVSFESRARRFEEQIELLRRLWQNRSVTFQGEFHHVTAAGLNPLPVQRPIPIWIGGSAEPALRRAAVLGDGYFPQKPLPPGWRDTLSRMRAWREEAGLSWDGFGIEARLNVFTPGQTSPDDWRRVVDEWRGLGASHLSVNTMGGGLKTVYEHLDVLQKVCDVLARG